MKKNKLIITGHARHGKDTVAELLHKNHGMTYKSPTQFIAEEMIVKRNFGNLGYTNVSDAIKHRGEHREVWFNAFSEYNKDFKGRLVTEILAEHDVYCGLRCKEELYSACEYLLKETGVRPIVLWVERNEYPPEDKSSNTITVHDTDYILWNSGTLKDLEEKVEALYKGILLNVEKTFKLDGEV